MKDTVMSRNEYIMGLLISCMICVPARADWINLSGADNAPTIAEIYIQDDHVKVVLEIYIGDLPEFEQLLPDEFFRKNDIKIDRPVLAERLKHFSEETTYWRFQFVLGALDKIMCPIPISGKEDPGLNGQDRERAIEELLGLMSWE